MRFCLKVGYFKHERHFPSTRSSYQRGCWKVLRLLSVQNQYLPGDVSSTCLGLIRSKLCVGGEVWIHRCWLSNSPNRDIPDPERASYSYPFVICGGHVLKHHIGHFVFWLWIEKIIHLPFSFMRLPYNMVLIGRAGLGVLSAQKGHTMHSSEHVHTHVLVCTCLGCHGVQPSSVGLTPTLPAYPQVYARCLLATLILHKGFCGKSVLYPSFCLCSQFLFWFGRTRGLVGSQFPDRIKPAAFTRKHWVFSTGWPGNPCFQFWLSVNRCRTTWG